MVTQCALAGRSVNTTLSTDGMQNLRSCLLFVAASDVLGAAVLVYLYNICVLGPKRVPWRGGSDPVFPVEECDCA